MTKNNGQKSASESSKMREKLMLVTSANALPSAIQVYRC